jgi:hypothetical protein
MKAKNEESDNNVQKKVICKTVMTYIHEGDKLSGLSIYIKYFSYFANNLFLHIVIRLFIFGFHHCAVISEESLLVVKFQNDESQK